jgi:hypothetical protein
MTAVEVSELVRNWGLVAAGFTGLAIAIWRAIAADRQSRAQRDGLYQTRREYVTTLFSEAVPALDDDKLHVRLGAIFTLREIVEAFPNLSRPTVDLLSAYLESVEYDGIVPRDVEEFLAIIVPKANSEARL